MKMLIVEDNAVMRRLLRSLLAGLTEEIHECTDGSQALAAYRQFLPDWVLMDIEMPELDGLAATRQLLAAFPDARVVIVTQHDNAKFREAAFRSGACGFVAKDNLLELRTLVGATA
jgi:CheY-like chemotaxis protein